MPFVLSCFMVYTHLPGLGSQAENAMILTDAALHDDITDVPGIAEWDTANMKRRKQASP